MENANKNFETIKNVGEDAANQIETNPYAKEINVNPEKQQTMKNHIDVNVIHCSLKPGTVGHYNHYLKEYDRIKEMAENATGEDADSLYMELDYVKSFLDEYEDLS